MHPNDADIAYGQAWLLRDAKPRCSSITIGFFA